MLKNISQKYATFLGLNLSYIMRNKISADITFIVENKNVEPINCTLPFVNCE